MHQPPLPASGPRSAPGFHPPLAWPLLPPQALALRMFHGLTAVLAALLAGVAMTALRDGARTPVPTSMLHPLWGGQGVGGLLELLSLAAALLLAVLMRRQPLQRWLSAAAALALLLAWPVPCFFPHDPAAAALLAAMPGPISPDWQAWLALQALGQTLRFGLQLGAAASLALALALPAPRVAWPQAASALQPGAGPSRRVAMKPARYHRLD